MYRTKVPQKRYIRMQYKCIHIGIFSCWHSNINARLISHLAAIFGKLVPNEQRADTEKND